jgi:hypothetical protein
VGGNEGVAVQHWVLVEERNCIVVLIKHVMRELGISGEEFANEAAA